MSSAPGDVVLPGQPSTGGLYRSFHKKDSGVKQNCCLLIALHPAFMAKFGPWVNFIGWVRWIRPVGYQAKEDQQS